MAWIQTTLLWPTPWHSISGASVTLDASGEKAAIIFCSRRTATMTGFRFQLSNVTTGQTLKGSLQALDSSGNPDGTILASGTVAVANTDDYTIKGITFGTAYTVAAGQLVAAVIEFDSTAGDLEILGAAEGGLPGDGPVRLYEGGSWGETSIRYPVFVPIWSDNAIVAHPGILPPSPDGGWSDLLTEDGTPDEIGNRITLPFNAMCSELWAFGVFQGTSISLVLYDSASNVIASVSRDGDAFNAGHCLWRALLPKAVLLTNNTGYRVTALPAASSLVVDYGMHSVEIGSYLYALPYGMQSNPFQPSTYRTYRTDGGSWSSDDTRLMDCGLVLSAIDGGAVAPAGWTPQGQTVGTPPPIVMLA